MRDETTPPSLERSRGTLRLAVRQAGGATRIDRLHQAGCLKCLLPRATPGAPLEAVLVNTAGGLTGGDRLDLTVEAAAGADLVVTSQGAERLYRSVSGAAAVSLRLSVAEGASLAWLPRETIAFEAGALQRTIEADIVGSGRLVLLESLVLGRQAMGETLSRLTLHDRWRIRRAGRLLHAEDLRLDDAALAAASDAAVLGGRRAIATLVMIGGEPEQHLGPLRAVLDDMAAGGRLSGGASAFGGRLVLRLLAEDGQLLRKALHALLDLAGPLPRLWSL